VSFEATGNGSHPPFDAGHGGVRQSFLFFLMGVGSACPFFVHTLHHRTLRHGFLAHLHVLHHVFHHFLFQASMAIRCSTIWVRTAAMRSIFLCSGALFISASCLMS